MLVELGEERRFAGDTYTLAEPMRVPVQALILARQNFEKGLEDPEGSDMDFLRKDLERRLSNLTHAIIKNKWSKHLPRAIDLGYIDQVSEDNEPPPYKPKLFYKTTQGRPELAILDTYFERRFRFFGQEVEKIDWRIVRSPRPGDWEKTGPVDIYLFRAIPEDKRYDALEPWYIPQSVTEKLFSQSSG